MHSLRLTPALFVFGFVATASLALPGCGSDSNGSGSAASRTCTSNADCRNGEACVATTGTTSSALCADPGGHACGGSEECLVPCTCNDGAAVSSGACLDGACADVASVCSEACANDLGFSGTCGGPPPTGAGGETASGGAPGGAGAPTGTTTGVCRAVQSSGAGGSTGAGGDTASGGSDSAGGAPPAQCDATDPSGQSCISDAECKVSCHCSFTDVTVGKCQGLYCTAIESQCNAACSAITENYSGQHCLAQ
ncbi:MAG TPA: hypothetical protein VHE30_09635 [Polyangiaceae bacterium]|nr:hypothetical protein [Polyangiaceae bacterium]